MITKLVDLGITSDMAYTAGAVSVGLSVLTWTLSKKKEDADTARADRWGIFVGQWAPTLIALGVALRLEENNR